jgi:hypothetical protein
VTNTSTTTATTTTASSVADGQCVAHLGLGQRAENQTDDDGGCRKVIPTQHHTQHARALPVKRLSKTINQHQGKY